MTRPDPRGRRWIPGVAVLIAAVIGLVVWALVDSGSSPRAKAIPGPNTLLQQAENKTYHAIYAANGDPRVTGGKLTVEVWQSPPEFREDTLVVSGPHTVHTETYSNGTSGRICISRDNGAWSCRTLTVAEARSAGVGGFAMTFQSAIATGAVTQSTETVAGRTAHCFTIRTGGGTKLCLENDGIPILITDAKVSYQLTSIDSQVQKRAFAPPG